MLEMEDSCWKRQVPGGMCEVVRWKESLDPEWLCRCAVIRIFCKFSRQWDVKSDSLRFSLGLRGEDELENHQIQRPEVLPENNKDLFTSKVSRPLKVKSNTQCRIQW